MRRRTTMGDNGQTTLEFLGLLPILFAVLIAVWQGAMLALTFIFAGHAAAAGARAVSVGADARAAAVRDLPSGWRDAAAIRLDQWPAAPGTSPAPARAVDVDLSVPLLFPGLWHLPLHFSGRAGVLQEDRP
ncbi:hypothetical protein [Kitasatospora sp. NPDC059571]|uniref:hypothetical protein n=1 Tax=Kitasatospora sp. NPDC059571 TaxID=3346871 RepID=UPI0036C78D35